MHLTRSLLLAACCLLLAVPFTSVTAQEEVFFPTTDWRVSSPEAQGMDSAELAGLFANFSQDEFNLDSLLVLRHGVIVAEAYAPPFEQEMPHHLWSASKSVISALVGILLRDGYLDSLDTPILSLFPDMTAQNVDMNKEAMTVRHLLIMGSGLSCDMYMPGGDPGEGMFTSADWLQYALNLPMAWEPGSEFHYCNANIYILSALITELTGMPAVDFAAQELFAPLGITDYSWESSPQGLSVGASGLHLTTRDMAKIGYLYLHDGMWDGVQIIPSDYVAESLSAQIDSGWPDTNYGLLWWNIASAGTYAALGAGGQYIVLVPEKDIVIAATGTMLESLRPYIQGYPINYMAAGLTAADAPLPENAEALGQLETQIARITSPALIEAVQLPALAEQISGRVYGLLSPLTLPLTGVIGSREGNLPPSAALRLDFTDEARASLTFINADGTSWLLPIGLDGSDQVTNESPLGSVAGRGEWGANNELCVWLSYVGDGQIIRMDLMFMPGGLEIQTLNVSRGTTGLAFGVMQPQ
jgi:CubicO group peptidase (beta-lactamase class C family)